MKFIPICIAAMIFLGTSQMIEARPLQDSTLQQTELAAPVTNKFDKPTLTQKQKYYKKYLAKHRYKRAQHRVFYKNGF